MGALDEGNFLKLAEINFVGREKEISILSEWLNSPARKPIMIAGVGGIGKTTLVSEFVRRNYKSEQVAWLGFHDTPTSEGATDKLVNDIAASATAPEIVVLDDVDQLPKDDLSPLMARIKQILPEVPIIYTSRQRIDSDSAVLPLGSLQAAESVELLIRLGLDRQDPDLSRLAVELANHPLALKIGASLAKTRAIPELITELQKNLYELEQGSIVQAAQPSIVIATDQLIAHLSRQPTDLYKLPPRKFEELIAELLKDMGWEVHLTKQTRDGGRDILAFLNTDLGRFLCLVEAKRYSQERPVGVEIVRNLYGTLSDEQANSALLVTTSHFSSDAKEFQSRHVYQISLREYRDVVDWITRWRKK